MEKITHIIIIGCLLGLLISCDDDNPGIATSMSELARKNYFSSEVFSSKDLTLYGTWEVYAISGGFSGAGYEVNFETLVIQKYGVYGFVRNDSLLEYGQIAPAIQDDTDTRLKVNLVKDALSASFFGDPVKFIEFNGEDTLHLNSPCCDRYNYHFVRVK